MRALLEKPTWSVRSLLPPPGSTSSSSSPSPETAGTEEITPQSLAHLLRLSALPPPSDPAEEASLLATLRNQLHFVRSIQSVDTTGVPPLRAIRDETASGLQAQTIGLDTLKEALDQEDVVGHSQRPRRRREVLQGKRKNEAEDWDVLAGAGETAGRYFVVRSGNGSDAAQAPKSTAV
jgi:Asp-tRNA(Asn)/Glu-tRNA(Gln) amidotransferase C subunit